MRRAFVAELRKLRRRSVFVAAAAVATLLTIVTTLVTFLPAKSEAELTGPRGLTATLESLAQPDGAIVAFRAGIGFLGVLLLAVFITNIGFEYARGTFAAALMKQPRRLRLLGGKMAALLLFLACTVAVAEVAGVLLGGALASARGISTAAWFSAAGLVEALEAYGTALFVVSAWATFGMAVAIFTRSVPVALGIAIAWAGPAEHITEQAWPGARGWFPGLLLEAFSAGGTGDVSSQRALVMVLVYAGLLASAAAVTFSRRDVTA
jgi:ABC-type transport system involved in multi-copper enzyme maturation permease subunit